MDLLAEMLKVSGVQGTIAARVDAGARWGWWNTEIDGAAFHAITAGTAWLGVPGQQPLQLMPGDVVLLPSGTDHVLASDPSLVSRDRRADDVSSDGGVYRIGSGPTQTRVLCARYHHDPAVVTDLLASLPEVMHIRASDADDGLGHTVHLIAQELACPQFATEVILNRLVDVLLVQLLRAWLSSESVRADSTWIGVLNDPLVAGGLTRLFGDPSRDWTTESLAAELSVSRATVLRRFLGVTGESPSSHLTRWRMDIAALRLRDTDKSLESIAQSIGYTSVYAFSRAFSRSRGQPPGRFRTISRQSLERDIEKTADRLVAHAVRPPLSRPI